MNSLVPITLIGWIPAVLLLFAVLPPRRAVIAAYVGAWLFLPMAGYQIQGLPDYTKVTATGYAALLGVLLFDGTRLVSLRPSWVDLPIAVWCIVPFASSIVNGHGAYDGTSGVLSHVVSWGLPYLFGRLYYSDWEGLRDLAIGILIGGLIYMPLCLWEIRMSPRLHRAVYGYHQHSLSQHYRFGGYRPKVFMQHGLAVGLWMALSSLLGLWLWLRGGLVRLWGVPMKALAPALAATTILCKSLGAIILFVGGVAVLFAPGRLRTAGIAGLVLVVPLYLAARVQGGWTGEKLVELAAVIDSDRASSLQGRLRQEDRLVVFAMQRPLLGRGASGGWRHVEDDQGRVVTDSLWIITLGPYGLAGLVSMTLTILLPPALILHRIRPALWEHPAASPAVGLAMVVVLHMIDCLVNAMLNPVYLLAVGGMASVAVLLGRPISIMRAPTAMQHGAERWQRPVGAVVPPPGPSFGRPAAPDSA